WRDTWWNDDSPDLSALGFWLERGGDALFVGWGAGHWSLALHRRLHPEAAITGLDREPSFLEAARERARTRAIAWRDAVGDASSLPFPDDSFDLTTCQTVLIHVPDAAAVVAEMVRVTRPGGIVLLVEPDNLTVATSMLQTSVPLRVEEHLALVELQLRCEAGKRALAEGEGSVGARLPALLEAAGVNAVRAFSSDKCAVQRPPYTVPEEAFDLDAQLGFTRIDCWLQTGPRDDTRRHFLAGGGDAAAFERCWSVACAWMRAFEAQVDAGTFRTTRVVPMVLCAGQAPATHAPT
ncbi:MAG: class I SAM-dependent methyltransferase, partial [Myxococcota bacterium]